MSSASCCVTAGLLLLLFVVLAAVVDRRDQRNRTQDATVTPLDRRFAARRRTPTARPAASPSATEAVPVGKAFAILRIPRLGAAAAAGPRGRRPDVLAASATTPARPAPGRRRQLRRRGAPHDLRQAVHDIDKLRPGDVIVVETRAAYTSMA